MQLLVDEQQRITSYATVGGLDNGIDYQGPTPDDFVAEFKSGRYLLQNGVIVLNANYVVPDNSVTSETPTSEQQLLMQQDRDVFQLKQLVMDQEAKIATLSKGSAE